MKRKNEKSANIWDKIINTLWYLLFGFMFGMLLLIFASIKGHCASSPDYALPFRYSYIDDYQSYFVNNSSALQTIINAHNISDIDNCVIFIFESSETNTNLNIKTVLITEEDMTNFKSYNSSNTLITLSDFTNFTSDYFIINKSNSNKAWKINKSTLNLSSISSSGAIVNPSVLGLHVPNNLGITFCYPIYIKGELKINDTAIFTVDGGSVPIQYGHATPPDSYDNPYFNPNSHAQPPEEVPPQVTINNYTWNTYNPPAIDDTDIISTLKSLIYVVNYLMGWLKDNISGEFQNLIANLKDLFDYIGQTIQYYGGLIISNIQNLITTFYNNMVSLGENIAEKVAYISEPFDSNALIDAFESMQIYDDYDRCGQLIDDAFGFFDDISEPQSFTIPIDLRGITLLHQTQILYLDLGWINSAKGVIRAFMWTVTTFGLLYTVIDSIPDYIQGQDE